MVKLLELHLGVAREDLEFEATFALTAGSLRATDDREAVRVRHLLVKCNLRTEQLKVGDAGLKSEVFLGDLAHDLALLARYHPADHVLALEGATRFILLGHADVTGARLVDSQLELGHLTEFSRETS